MLEGFRINENSGVPVWIQIRNHLVFAIKAGQIVPGDELPTVRSFATQLGVNYNTVHRVYQDLESDGYISSSRGRRSFVTEFDRDSMGLPDSPVDLVIDELVKTARDCCVTKEDVLMRLESRFAAEEN